MMSNSNEKMQEATAKRARKLQKHVRKLTKKVDVNKISIKT